MKMMCLIISFCLTSMYVVLVFLNFRLDLWDSIDTYKSAFVLKNQVPNYSSRQIVLHRSEEVGHYREKNTCSIIYKVIVEGKNGKVDVPQRVTTIIELTNATNRFIWYCDKTERRNVNDRFFNYVECYREHDGSIYWVYYNKRSN